MRRAGLALAMRLEKRIAAITKRCERIEKELAKVKETAEAALDYATPNELRD